MTLRKLRKKAALITAALAVPAVILMLLFVGSRRMLMTDVVARAETAPSVGYELTRTASSGEESGVDLVIPLPDNVHFENVRIENRYMEHRLMVYIDSDAVDHYHDLTIPCNEKKVIYGACLVDEGAQTFALRFDLGDLYEYSVDILNNRLRFTFTPPAEKYRHIAVIDPLAGQDDNDTTLYIAEKLKELNAGHEEEFKLYVTRTGADAAEDAERLGLSTGAGADRYVMLSAKADAPSGAASLTAYYNDAFFIRGYGNVDMADELLQQTAVRSGIVNGSFSVSNEQTNMLTYLRIPSAALFVEGIGDVRTDEAAAKIADEIAEGIYDAIARSFAKEG